RPRRCPSSASSRTLRSRKRCASRARWVSPRSSSTGSCRSRQAICRSTRQCKSTAGTLRALRAWPDSAASCSTDLPAVPASPSPGRSRGACAGRCPRSSSPAGSLPKTARRRFAKPTRTAWTSLATLLRDYAGRPTPLLAAKRLAEACEVRAKVFLKREDLLHTGAHKLNNTLGQALLARRMGKKRVIAETGAGQHGVATATVCALLGLECIVYMGAEDVRRQAPNVSRMGLLGAEVRPVEAGSRTLKD